RSAENLLVCPKRKQPAAARLAFEQHQVIMWATALVGEAEALAETEGLGSHQPNGFGVGVPPPLLQARQHDRGAFSCQFQTQCSFSDAQHLSAFRARVAPPRKRWQLFDARTI